MALTPESSQASSHVTGTEAESMDQATAHGVYAMGSTCNAPGAVVF